MEVLWIKQKIKSWEYNLSISLTWRQKDIVKCSQTMPKQVYVAGAKNVYIKKKTISCK